MAKILLVDDAAFMRMMLKTTLTQAGYTDLIEAEDGAKAVNYRPLRGLKTDRPLSFRRFREARA